MPITTLLSSKTQLKNPKELRHHRAHAIVGAYVLGHFIYRYVLFFFTDVDDMGFGSHDGDIDNGNNLNPRNLFLVFLPHILLQLSGFGFKLPPNRHPEGNRIWNEYRWHALAFSCRCMALIFMANRCKNGNFPCHNNSETDNTTVSTEYILSTAILFLNMMSVDSITLWFKSHGSESTTTIRGLKGPPILKYFMSVTQFHANLNCLLTKNNLSVQFAALTVVQSSAFGMTLRRKGLISHIQGLCLYSMVLLIGMVVIVNDLYGRNFLFPAVSISNIAAMMRIDLALNKYLLWLLISFLIPIIIETNYDDHHGIWKLVVVGSTLSLVINGYNRQQLHIETKQKE